MVIMVMRKILAAFFLTTLRIRNLKNVEYDNQIHKLKFPTHRGAVIDPRVKTTSGGLDFGVVAFPNKMTVSPLKTFFTRATPLAGRTVARGTAGAAATVVIL